MFILKIKTPSVFLHLEDRGRVRMKPASDEDDFGSDACSLSNSTRLASLNSLVKLPDATRSFPERKRSPPSEK